MVKAHGPATVIEAIRRASERIQGDLTIAYLRPVVASVAAGDPEAPPKGSEQGKRYQSAAWDKSPQAASRPLGACLTESYGEDFNIEAWGAEFLPACAPTGSIGRSP